MSRFIEIIEVGPRDGLQNEAAVLSPEQRADFCTRLEAAGAKRIEVASFVHPKYVPQMAGAEALISALPARPDHRRIGLVLNTKGWQRAALTDLAEVNVALSASDGFGLKNQGLDVKAQLQMLSEVVEGVRAQNRPITVSATFSVVWGCPFEGEISDDQVEAVVREAASLKVDEIALADTIGVGDPWSVRRKIERAQKVAGDIPLRLHFHDTRNTGLANAFAGIEAGVTRLDASCGGIGGCPFAPRATGNIATEDLVYMVERAGFETGYDLEALIEASGFIGGLIGKDVPSRVAKAGGFPKIRA